MSGCVLSVVHLGAAEILNSVFPVLCLLPLHCLYAHPATIAQASCRVPIFLDATHIAVAP